MAKINGWPRRELAAVPRLKIAKKLAKLVYDSCGLDGLNREDSLKRIFGMGGFDVTYTEDLGGTLEALLVPRKNGYNKFDILVGLVNRTRPKRLGTPKSGIEMDYEILHEVGHSFFYKIKEEDIPLKLTKYSPMEELFCDVFAAQLLKLIRKNDNRN